MPEEEYNVHPKEREYFLREVKDYGIDQTYFEAYFRVVEKEYDDGIGYEINDHIGEAAELNRRALIEKRLSDIEEQIEKMAREMKSLKVASDTLSNIVRSLPQIGLHNINYGAFGLAESQHIERPCRRRVQEEAPRQDLSGKIGRKIGPILRSSRT